MVSKNDLTIKNFQRNRSINRALPECYRQGVFKDFG